MVEASVPALGGAEAAELDCEQPTKDWRTAMSTNGRQLFPRRKFLMGSAGLGSGVLMGNLLSPPSARADVETLNMWWWGEQELPGLQAFVSDSVKNYTAANVKNM